MEWLTNIIQNPGSIAHLVVIYALVISLGVKLGKIKFGGISLGVTFVLFVGIVVGHIYSHYIVDPKTNEFITHAAQKETIDFVKELGLILFVYFIGLQVGPGFFATFKKGGVGMNLIAAGIVLLNILVMLGLYFLVFPQNNYNLAMMVGTMYGAVTNTPGLGAATSVVKDFGGDWGALGAIWPLVMLAPIPLALSASSWLRLPFAICWVSNSNRSRRPSARSKSATRTPPRNTWSSR